ncbi:MAG: MarR family transcriptional regulator [Pseudomonadota bacterium]|uniref:MarR family winged helix-turn-helix transcriptional regulator n=1 Tax=Phenylobacterium sp. TaxID=1871053 RepID=UPI0025E1AFA5|nr:MarR family transcriptional regulator [Phenylobacterium sp.]MBT9470401.1 MarR family transcriptional regulator [Phenylobacterium sp.]
MITKTKTKTQSPAVPTVGDRLRLDNQLCFALYAASGLVTRAYRPLLEPLGLTYPQYLVMLALWEQAPRTVKALGQALELDSGTLTPLLKRLESAGFVTRTRDVQDERRVQIALTQAGEALREKAAEVPVALACQLQLPLDEIANLRTTLQDLARKMKAAD